MHEAEYEKRSERQGDGSEGGYGYGEGKVNIGNGNVVTALVSTDAIQELDVKVGEDIQVLIKATSVMLAKD